MHYASIEKLRDLNLGQSSFSAPVEKEGFEYMGCYAGHLSFDQGSALRHLHDKRVDQRMETIEKAMKNNHNLEHSDLRKIAGSGSISAPACFATAGTTLIIGMKLKRYTSMRELIRRTDMQELQKQHLESSSLKEKNEKAQRWLKQIMRTALCLSHMFKYGLGWRGGKWYANRKFRKEQMKLLGQINPRVGSRTKLISVKSQDGMSALAPVPNDGICTSMVETQGYVCEEHKVITQDGYILSMQRIPEGRSGKTPGNQPPILLQHGLLMDGITWLLLPPDQSLAFLLADDGFDVWLVNTRGTKYSRGHTSLNPNDPAYWDWSWDELVAYDLPATFQYVHDQAGQKLHYVGHSLGTLMALAAFSKDQLLNMVRSAALLSPIAYVGQMTSPLARNAADNFMAEALYWLGINEFNPRGRAVIKLLKDICNKPGVDCTNLLNAFTGQNCCLNSSIVDVFLDHEPQSTATKNMIHLAQMIREGNIAMYDYNDEDENRKHYGQPTPPVYNMTSIPNDLPLFLSYGGADALSDVKDVQLLLDSLKDHDGDKLVVQYRDDYAHADYVMGQNAKQVVYDPLVAFFRLQ
uniref:Partial AB-hydrolase lipase domain-containing protein n=1 Tax=Fagus sylvatica TaxID=28930 RepID=A0A2N9ETQ2_FAGSY